MTDQKKTSGKSGTKSKKKLQLNKETIRDLSATEKGDQIRGGMPGNPGHTKVGCPWCTGGYTDNA